MIFVVVPANTSIIISNNETKGNLLSSVLQNERFLSMLIAVYIISQLMFISIHVNYTCFAIVVVIISTDMFSQTIHKSFLL